MKRKAEGMKETIDSSIKEEKSNVKIKIER